MIRPMAGYHLNVIVPLELERALRQHARDAGLSVSQATRDLLRHALGVVPTTRDAGWREGYTAASAEVSKAVQTALAEVARGQKTS